MQTLPPKSVRGRRCPSEPPSSWLVGGGIEILWPKESSPLGIEEWKNYCFDRDRIKFYSHSYDQTIEEGACEVEWNNDGIIYRTRWRPAALDRRTSRKRRQKPESCDGAFDSSTSGRRKKRKDEAVRQHEDTAARRCTTARRHLYHTSISALKGSPGYANLLRVASEAAFAAIDRVERERCSSSSSSNGINAAAGAGQADSVVLVPVVSSDSPTSASSNIQVSVLNDKSDDDTDMHSSMQGRVNDLRASKVFNATAAQGAAKRAELEVEESASADDAEDDDDNDQRLCEGIRAQIAVNRELWEQCKTSMKKRPSGEHPQSVRMTHAEGEEDDEESKGFMSFERSYARIKVVCKEADRQHEATEESERVKKMLRGLAKRGLANQMPSQFLLLEMERSEPVHIMLRGLAKNVPNKFAEFISPKEETREGFIIDYKVGRSIWTDIGQEERTTLLRNFQSHLDSINQSLTEIVRWLDEPKEWKSAMLDIIGEYGVANQGGGWTVAKVDMPTLEQLLKERKPDELKEVLNWEYDLT